MAGHEDLGALINQPPINISPPQDEGARATRQQGFTELFNNPAVIAALLQFGAQVSQPRAAGQSTLGAVTAAAASGAGAAGRAEAAQRGATTEADTAARQSRETAATEERARAATSQAATSREGLVVERERIKSLAETAAATAGLRLSVAETGLLTDLFEAEEESAFLADRPTDFNAVIQRFNRARRVLQGEIAPAGTPGGRTTAIKPEQLTDAEWKVVFADPDLETRLRAAWTAEQIAVMDKKKAEIVGKSGVEKETPGAPQAQPQAAPEAVPGLFAPEGINVLRGGSS